MEIGQQLQNRYTIQQLIGEGATATVYLAHDERLRRKVAIKVLLPYVRATARARFAREARSAASLNHPNIMAIYDEAKEDDTHFLVAEYVEGQTLLDFIPVDPEQVANLGTQIAMALDYAHRMDIIHRDIKPANIKVALNGQVKIMDFGLAKAKDAKHITAHGSIIGTPAYLSPEQAQGKPLDYRTDIYSLGVILYEMATGTLPFDGTRISELLIQKVKHDPIPAGERNAGLPLWLEDTIMKALARSPEDRFQTARELAAALQQGIQPADDGHAAPASDVSLIRQEDMPTEEAGAFNMMTAIVADDHDILRTSVAFLLDDQPDITVIGEAGTGNEVLELIANQAPDLLLLDLNMPGKSGLDILPVIRKEYPQVKILILTGRAEDSFIMRSLQAGAHGYLNKTSSQDDLLAAVYKVFAGKIALGDDITQRVVSGLIDEAKRDPMNAQERDIMLCIVGGIDTNTAIAEKLGITEQDVVSTLKHAIDKIGAQSRSQAALIALRAGWITVEEAHQR